MNAPYQGLVPFSAEDGPFFFGRDRECELAIANLRGRRLTLLYGASGVGKSSLLHAGVAHRLRRLAHENRDRDSTPDLAVVVFSRWSVNPMPALREALNAAVADACGRTFDPLPDDLGLVDTLNLCVRRVDGVVLILLDQFEDYLLADPSSDESAFEDELAAAVNAPELRANFVVSLKEEFLARLDRFEGKIPDLFKNYLRLEHLKPGALQDAIVKPLEEWNRVHGLTGTEAYRVEPELVDEILRQRAIGRMVQTDGSDVLPSGATPRSIETAYLQLVMRRLWDEEIRLNSRVLRHSTLTGRLGGASQIVKTHLDAVLSPLSTGEQRHVAALFGYLVTPAGYKARPSVVDLVGYTGLTAETVETTLRHLADPNVRIVRPVGGLGGVFYEVFHDVLIPAVGDWRRRMGKEVELAAQREKLAREKRKSRLLIGGLTATIVLLAGVALFAIWAFRQNRRANEEQARADKAVLEKLVLHAEHLRDNHLDLSLLLSIRVHELGYSGRQSPLITGLNHAVGLEAVLGRLDGEVLGLNSSPDGRQVAAASANGTVEVWSINKRHRVSKKSAEDWVPISSLTFSADGRMLATASVDGTVRLWSLEEGLLPGPSFRMPGASTWSLTSSADGALLALGGSDGNVHLWSVNDRRLLGNLTSPHRGAVQAMSFSPDGRTLATGASDGTVGIWSIQPNGSTKGAALQESGGAISTLGFSPNGMMLAAGQSDGTVRVWRDVRQRELTFSISSNSPVRSVVFAPDGLMIATASDDGVLRLWSVFGGSPMSPEIRAHKNRMRSIAFTPNTQNLISGQQDGTIQIWSIGVLTNRAAAQPESASLKARACRIANRNLSLSEWRQFMGETPYRRICAEFPAGEGVPITR